MNRFDALQTIRFAKFPAAAAIALIAALAGPAGPGAVGAAEPARPSPSTADAGPGVVEAIYHVDQIEVLDAIMMAHQLCRSMTAVEKSCEYRTQGRAWFSYTAPPAVQEKIAALLKQRDVPQPTLNFRVVLLLGEGAERPAPALPEGERRALADLQKVFPYRGYTLLDSGAIRSRDRASLTLGGDAGYTASLLFTRSEAGRGPSIAIEKFTLTRRTAEPGDAAGGKEPRRAEMLETSFSMQVGETVVVGTSRLDGNDRALIVLLTAAP